MKKITYSVWGGSGLPHEIELAEGRWVRFYLDEHTTIDVGFDDKEGLVVRATGGFSSQLAIRPSASNSVHIVPVHSGNLQVEPVQEPYMLARALEVLASNATFIRHGPADVRLNALANDLHAYARRIREAAGDPQAMKDREEYEAGLLNAGADDAAEE